MADVIWLGDVQFLGDHTVGTPLGDCPITMYAAGTRTRVDKEDVPIPPVSEAQRRLMWAAAGKKGGVDGVPHLRERLRCGDPGGKLPKKKTKGETLYDHPRSARNRKD